MFNGKIYVLTEIDKEARRTEVLSAKFEMDFKDEIYQRIYYMDCGGYDKSNVKFDVEVYKDGICIETHMFDYTKDEFIKIEFIF